MLSLALKTWFARQYYLLLLSFPQTEPLQQEICEELPDCRRALQRATADRFLPQDGDETSHSAGGEWLQAAFCYALHCFHAVSLMEPYGCFFISTKLGVVVMFYMSDRLYWLWVNNKT